MGNTTLRSVDNDTDVFRGARPRNEEEVNDRATGSALGLVRQAVSGQRNGRNREGIKIQIQ